MQIERFSSFLFGLSDLTPSQFALFHVECLSEFLALCKHYRCPLNSFSSRSRKPPTSVSHCSNEIASKIFILRQLGHFSTRINNKSEM